MATSEAQIKANRSNCLMSKGPVSAEGREQSRKNSLKHGLTGAGIVTADRDSAEIEHRFEQFLDDLAPRTEYGRTMVRHMALMSVRFERCVEHVSASQAIRVRHSVEAFDEERIDRAEGLFEAIGEDPRGSVRQLRRFPEGVERLVEAWGELHEDLTRAPKPIWTAWHLERATNLIGRKVDDFRGSRIADLSKAVRGDFSELADHEGGDLTLEARKDWARERLVERIEAELNDLEAHHGSFDYETIEADRAVASDLALFDPSKEATLARRYESEARREFFRALKELRRVEAEVAERPAPPESVPSESAPLASSRENDLPPPRDPRPVVQEASTFTPSHLEPAVSMAQDAFGHPLAIGRDDVGRS